MFQNRVFWNFEGENLYGTLHNTKNHLLRILLKPMYHTSMTYLDYVKLLQRVLKLRIQKYSYFIFCKFPRETCKILLDAYKIWISRSYFTLWLFSQQQITSFLRRFMTFSEPCMPLGLTGGNLMVMNLLWLM